MLGGGLRGFRRRHISSGCALNKEPALGLLRSIPGDMRLLQNGSRDHEPFPGAEQRDSFTRPGEARESGKKMKEQLKII